MADTALYPTGRQSRTAADLQTGAGHDAQSATNVGQLDRWLSMLAGGGLVAFGLTRGKLTGLVSALTGAALIQRGATGHCKCYEMLGYNTAVEHHDFGVKARAGQKIVRSLHVNRDRHELYNFWRNLENLPQVMRHLVSVRPTSETGSHWVARGPMGATLEWDAEMINDRPGEIIAWQSRPESQVATAGSVRFDPPTFGQGTVITVSLKYDPPGGKATAQLAHLVGQGLEDELDEDLRAFKQLMEAGERPTAATQPAGQPSQVSGEW